MDFSNFNLNSRVEAQDRGSGIFPGGANPRGRRNMRFLKL